MNRQVSVAHEEALKKKFSGHRFVLSPVGILKIIGIILLMVASIISLSAQVCSLSNHLLEVLFPIVSASSGVLTALTYVGAILGIAKKMPNTFAKMDICCCLLTSIITLIVSIFLLSNCSGVISKVPGILGIVGASILTIIAAILFVTWRNEEDTIEEVPTRINQPITKRESVTNI